MCRLQDWLTPQKVEKLDKNTNCFIKITTMDPPLTPFLINDVFEENMHAAEQSE